MSFRFYLSQDEYWLHVKGILLYFIFIRVHSNKRHPLDHIPLVVATSLNSGTSKILWVGLSSIRLILHFFFYFYACISDQLYQD